VVFSLNNLVECVTRASRPPTPVFGPGSDGWGENTSALLSLVRTAKQDGIPVLVALLPEASDFQKQRERHARVMAFCHTHGVECVDMLEEFERVGIPERQLRLNVVDGHPNVEYNRIVGARLGEYLSGRWPTAASARPVSGPDRRGGETR
jgi:hypothetical protein